MVVLAAAICTKTGKAIISRQFVEMPSSRIEGLLSTFPKLLSSKGQHTFVETESVRYVYQPLEDLYLVLVTNKNSNILQDIDTLALFCRIVPEYCRNNTEKEISRNAFDILLVFDEVISLGFREDVDLQRIRAIISMDSAEERIQAEIEKNKEREAKEELKRKAKLLDMQKKEKMMSNYGNHGYSSPQNYSSMNKTASFGEIRSLNNDKYAPVKNDTYSNQINVSSRGKGMQLGKKNVENDLINTIKAEEGYNNAPVHQMTNLSVSPEKPTLASPKGGIDMLLEEKLSLVSNRDGGVETMEIKGSLMLKIGDAACASCIVSLDLFNDSNIQYMVHDLLFLKFRRIPRLIRLHFQRILQFVFVIRPQGFLWDSLLEY